MCSLDTNPVISPNILTLFYFVVNFPTFTLNQGSRIGFIFQNPIDRYHRPFLVQSRSKSASIIESAGSFVLIWRQNSQFIQMVCNVLCAHPVELQLEDFLHDARRVFIYNQMIFVFRVFLIPVSCKAADELSFFPFYIQVASDTHGNVPAIGVVDKIVERNQDTSLIIVFFRTVIMIVDGDEADSHKWKDSFQITTRFNVVSAEAR